MSHWTWSAAALGSRCTSWPVGNYQSGSRASHRIGTKLSTSSSQHPVQPVEDDPVLLVLLELMKSAPSLHSLRFRHAAHLAGLSVPKVLPQKKSRGWKCSVLTPFTEAVHAQSSHMHPGWALPLTSSQSWAGSSSAPGSRCGPLPGGRSWGYRTP